MNARLFATAALAGFVAVIASLATPRPVIASAVALGIAVLIAGLITAVRRYRGCRQPFVTTLLTTIASLAAFAALWFAAAIAHSALSPTVCHPWTAPVPECRALYAGKMQ